MNIRQFRYLFPLLSLLVIAGHVQAQELPEDFQTDVFAFEHGVVDRVVRREDLRDELASLLGFFVEAA